MKKAVIAFAALAVLAIPVISDAAPVKPGPYFSAFLGVSALKDADLETRGYDWEFDTYYGSKDTVEFDPGIFVGGTGGYDFGIVRLEGELSYKSNEIDSINGWHPGYYYFDDQVGTFAFMANLFLDLHNDTPVTPYFGGGVGIATIYLSNDDNDYYYDDDDEDDDSVFAYQLGGGMEIALNRQLSLDLGYRYFVTDTARINVNTFYVSQSSTIKLESHNVAVGIRFKF